MTRDPDPVAAAMAKLGDVTSTLLGVYGDLIAASYQQEAERVLLVRAARAAVATRQHQRQDQPL